MNDNDYIQQAFNEFIDHDQCSETHYVHIDYMCEKLDIDRQYLQQYLIELGELTRGAYPKPTEKALNYCHIVMCLTKTGNRYWLYTESILNAFVELDILNSLRIDLGARFN